jgi:hypothetical protein
MSAIRYAMGIHAWVEVQSLQTRHIIHFRGRLQAFGRLVSMPKLSNRSRRAGPERRESFYVLAHIDGHELSWNFSYLKGAAGRDRRGDGL